MNYTKNKKINTIDKQDEEWIEILSKWWKMEVTDLKQPFKVIAKFQKSEKRDKNNQEFGYFIDVRNLNGDILYYPMQLGPVSIWTPYKSGFTSEEFWQINVKFSNRIKRENFNNPFMLELENTTVGKPKLKFLDKLEKERLIRKIFNETGSSERDAKNTSNALKAIMGDLYTETERFIFELLQNADDQPRENSKVNVTLKTLNEDLLFLHSGKPFSKDDVDSISSIGDSTKKNDAEKTGYKGIGFKSVFSEADTVYIDSGNFSFAFDKNSPIYPEECNMEEIPWQIKPIWEEKYRLPIDIQNQESFFSSSVGIALHVGAKNTEKYNHIIPNLLSDPRFALFLRNIGKIVFEQNNGQRIEITKIINNNIIQISSNNTIENWIISDFIIDIPQDIIDAIQSEILIPDKLKKATRTKISFATKISKNTINMVNDAVLFTYLPTKVNDFKFKFIVNADFLTTANRESIHYKNIWNQFILKEIGKLITKWCIQLHIHNDYINILPTEKISSINPLSLHFNTAYKTALETEAFILNHKGELAKQDAIIIDSTDLSTIIGAELFCKIIGTSKCLPSDKIDSKILKKDIFELIEKIDFNKVIDSITNNSNFNEWFISAPEEKKQKLYKWIKDNDITTRKDKIKTFVSTLPIFQFGDEHKSINEIKNTNYIIGNIFSLFGNKDYVVTTEHIAPIKEILEKLGFKCSDYLMDKEHPLFEFIVLPTDEEIFKLIKECDFSILSADERKTLFAALQDFNGVGDAKLKEIKLFKNVNGAFKPLGEMVAYRADTPIWLNNFVLCEEDNCSDLYYYLIESKNEFTEIIQNNFQDIEVSILELYQTYKNVWTGPFTRSLIDNYKIDNNLLTIIEESDTNTKNYFLDKTTKIEIFSTKKYDKFSFEYRTLRIALDVLSDPSEFSSKIFFDGQCISNFSVSDDVFCEYMQNGETKKVKMSLAKLLPTYKNESESIVKFKNVFEVKTGINNFFNESSKDINEIYSELNSLLNLDTHHSSPWPVGLGNAFQYLFSVYMRKRKWPTLYGFQIDLDKETRDFSFDILNFLYDNNISIKESSIFTFHLESYFTNKFFDNNFIFEYERVSPIIEQWADNDKKRQYLNANGVRNINSNSIKFRQLFLENKPIDFINKLTEEDLNSCIEFLAEGTNFNEPFKGENQKNILLSIKEKCPLLIDNFDIFQIRNNIKGFQYENKKYTNWIITNSKRKPAICFYEGTFPRVIMYRQHPTFTFSPEKQLLKYKETQSNYYYFESEKMLCISKVQGNKIEDILFEVAKKGIAGFTFDDYKILCMDGTITISPEELKQKDEEIERLKEQQVKELEELKQKDEEIERLKEQVKELEEYKKKFGELPPQQGEEGETGTITGGPGQGLPKTKKWAAQLEAQQRLMQEFPQWTFPYGYGEVKDNGEPYCFSTNEITDENDRTIAVVLKSYKKKDEPFRITTEEWDYLLKNNAVLLTYTGDDIKRTYIKDLIREQSHIIISFSTKNISVEERITAFADSLHYFEELTFDLASFNISNKVQSAADLYKRNKRAFFANDNTEDDI